MSRTGVLPGDASFIRLGAKAAPRYADSLAGCWLYSLHGMVSPSNAVSAVTSTPDVDSNPVVEPPKRGRAVFGIDEHQIDDCLMLVSSCPWSSPISIPGHITKGLGLGTQ